MLSGDEGVLAVGVLGLVATLEIFSFITFVQNYPFILVNMALFGTCSAAGQVGD